MNYRNISTIKVTFLGNLNFQSAGRFEGGRRRIGFHPLPVYSLLNFLYHRGHKGRHRVTRSWAVS